MSKLTEPYGQSRDDFEIFKGIAQAMEVEVKFTEGRSSSDWRRWIYDGTRENARALDQEMPAYSQFRNQGWFKFKAPEKSTIMLEDFRSNPDTHPLKTPSGKIEIFSETVAKFDYDDCPGFPFWRKPCEWLGDGNKEYPLHLISNQPNDKLHSQLDHGSVSQSRKVNGRAAIHIHPDDAAARGLKNDEIVQVFNSRGTCYAGVKLDVNLREGVIQMSTGAWYDPVDPSAEASPCKNGNPNVLTPDKGTSRLGQGPIAHSCMVQVAKFDGVLDTVTAYEPPVIIR
jgi:biotin/methionine sulfoxide reductase